MDCGTAGVVLAGLREGYRCGSVLSKRRRMTKDVYVWAWTNGFVDAVPAVRKDI